MNLVVQGARVTESLAFLRELSRATEVERLAPTALRFCDAQPHAELVDYCAAQALDWAWIPEGRKLSHFGLFITDMDSTLINIECIDEIADMQGLKVEVSAITEASMRGEIDFRESLTRRVALLEGLPETALAEVFEHRLRTNPGAETLLQGLKEAGVVTILVSGGFTYFTDRLKERLGFDYASANVLEVANGRLTGRINGALVDGQAKADMFRQHRERLGLTADRVMVLGDGANDVPMFSLGGFGIAYRAKPVLRKAASCCLDHAGLDGILRMFG